MNQYDEDLYKNKKMYRCKCFTEGLIIDGSDQEENEIYLSKWIMDGINDTWWNRIQKAWWFLCKGFVYEFGVIFTPEQALEFGQDLIKESNDLINKKGG